jgi:sulfur carrier protein
MSSRAAVDSVPITVNGQPLDVPAGATIESLLAQMDISAASTATALNGEFVPRTRRANIVLRAGDAVTCIQPITGG